MSTHNIIVLILGVIGFVYIGVVVWVVNTSDKSINFPFSGIGDDDDDDD